ncbi:MAG: hypothetical protein U0234_33255 [Sandaracinus sp.]
MSTEDDDIPGHELAGITQGRRSTLRGILAVCAFVVAIGWTFETRGDVLVALLRHEIDLSGDPIFEPRHAIDCDALARIDFALVHAHLVPEWLDAQAAADTPAGRRRAEYAYRALLEELEPDPNLSGLWREIHDRVAADPIASARRLEYLLWAHDAYMDRIGQPYRLEAGAFVQDGRGRMLARSYRAVVDLATPRGERVRVLRRLDRAPLVETWLGRTDREEEGAFVVVDRVLHFAIRHVWPALNAALDERLPERERGLAAGVRREVRAGLDDYAWSILSETAEDEQALLEAAASIESRHACGSRFGVFGIPYRGLSAHSRAMLRLALVASQGTECPDVTIDEATQLVAASERLRAQPDLELALEELVALVSRSVAAHELRHVADGPSAELECPGCEPDMTPLARAELSGYLAAFATPGLGYLAALGACSAPLPRDAARTRRWPDAVAIDAATRAALGSACEGPAPADLYARARRAERRYFGERVAVAPPASMPRSIEAVRRAPSVATR